MPQCYTISNQLQRLIKQKCCFEASHTNKHDERKPCERLLVCVCVLGFECVAPTAPASQLSFSQPTWSKQELCEVKLYETLYTFADHYLRLLCVNFGRPILALGLKKGDDVFPLIYYLHWATEREKGGEVGESGMPVTGALMPGITERNLLCSLISL